MSCNDIKHISKEIDRHRAMLWKVASTAETRNFNHHSTLKPDKTCCGISSKIVSVSASC